MQVDEARHQRRKTEIAHRLVGMQGTQVLEVADFDDLVVSDKHGTVLDVGRRDGQHVARGEQHGFLRIRGSRRFYRSEARSPQSQRCPAAYLTAVCSATTPPERSFQLIVVKPARRSSAASWGCAGNWRMESLR